MNVAQLSHRILLFSEKRTFNARAPCDAMYSIAKFLSTAILASVLVISDCKAFTAKHDVQFELHNRQNHTDHFEVLVADQYGVTDREPTSFDNQKPTRIYVHGYQSSRRSFLRYAKAFLKHSDCNFIVVNWLTGSVTKNYMQARGRVDRVSAYGML